MVLGDLLMFAGPLYRWWLLGLLCRLSLNPESCILRSADSFYRRGRILLIVAKFIPGINTTCPLLAGSMNMRFGQFLWLDFVGAVLYTAAYLAAGFLFSGAIGALIKGYHVAGSVVSWTLIGIAAAYLGYQFWIWRKARALSPVPMVSPAEAARSSSETAGFTMFSSHNC